MILSVSTLIVLSSNNFSRRAVDAVSFSKDGDSCLVGTDAGSVAVAAASETDATNQYVINGLDSGLTVVAGTTITFDATSGGFKIDIGGKNITFTPNQGYRMTSVTMSNSDTSKPRYVKAIFSYDDRTDSTPNITFDYNILNPTVYTGKLSFTTEQIDPTYHKDIKITAVTEEQYYTADLYDGRTKEEIELFTKEQRAFSISKPLDLNPLNANGLKYNDNTAWLFVIDSNKVQTRQLDSLNPDDDLTENEYHVIKTDGGTKLEVYYDYAGTGYNWWTLEYTRYVEDITSEGNIVYCFYVTNIQGNANFTEEHIFTKYSKEYRVNINSEDRSTYLQNAEAQYLAGAYSSNSGALTSKNKSASTYITIQDGYYGVRPQSSTQYDFYLYDDVDSSIISELIGSGESGTNRETDWYYVYKYGHYIKDWIISFDYDVTEDTVTRTETSYFKYQNGVWSSQESDNPIGCFYNNDNDNLYTINTSLADLAHYADRLDRLEVVESITPKSSTITMTPVWEVVDIDIYSHGMPGSSRYNNGYTTYEDENYLGQSIAYYTTARGSIVPKSSSNVKVWDFRNIDKEDYNFQGSHIYGVSLTPYLVDNIYQVKLNVNGLLEGSRYSTDSRNVNLPNEYTYETVPGSSLPQYHDYGADGGYSKTENYAAAYSSKVEEYIDKISDENIYNNTTYNIFNKVCTKDNGVSGLWIYLKNNHPIVHSGQYMLPVFTGTSGTVNAWINNGTNSEGKQYYYPTEADFNAENITGYDSDKHILGEKWAYTDDSTGGNVLNANYKQNFYYLTFDTTHYAQTKEVGYGIVEYTHGADTKYYLVIESNASAGAEVYEISGYSNRWTLPVNIANTYDYTFNSSDSGLTAVSGNKLTVFDGDIINVIAYDQNTASVWTDNMIGYVFDGFSCTGLNDSVADDRGVYTVDLTGEHGLTTLASYNIYINYLETTTYISFEIDNPWAGNYIVTGGSINLASELQTYEGQTVVNKQNEVIQSDQLGSGKTFKVEYWAQLGYEFKENEQFEVSILGGNTTYHAPTDEQFYLFTFDLSFIKENLNRRFPIDQEAVKITINTQLITFNYGVNVLDSSDSDIGQSTNSILKDAAGNNYTFQVQAGETVSLSMLNVYTESDGSTKLITESKTIAFYTFNYVYMNGDDPYAILNSKYYGDEYSDYAYSFPLVKEADVTNISSPYEITNIDLGMLTGTTAGQIIPNGNRTIYLMLEVRKILYATQQTIVYPFEGDIVPTEVKLTSQVSTTVDGSEYTENSITFTTPNITHGILKVMTYRGLTVILSAEYNENYIEKICYYGLNNSLPYTMHTFVDNTMTNEYQIWAKTILPVVQYQLNGTNTTLEDLRSRNIVDSTWECIVSPSGSLYYKTILTINMASLLDTTYDIELTTPNGIRYMGDSIDGVRHWVAVSDFDNGQVKIIVNIKEKPKSSVTVQMVDDQSQGLSIYNMSLATSSFGYENSAISATNSVTLEQIYDGHDLGISLASKPYNYEYRAYELYGISRAGGNTYVLDKDSGYFFYNSTPHEGWRYSSTEDSINILLTNSFDPANDQGTYTLIFKKVELTVTLDLSESNIASPENVYKLSKNGATPTDTITDAVIGDNITLVFDGQNTEAVLGIEIYETESAGIIEALTVNDGYTYVINELHFELAGRSFTIKPIFKNKYKLDVLFTEGSEDYIGTFSIKAGDEEFNYDSVNESDKYIKANTFINIALETKVRGKYSISVSGLYTASDLDFFITGQDPHPDNIYNGGNVYVKEITEDSTLTITIVKKQYDISITNTIKNELSGGYESDNSIEYDNTDSFTASYLDTATVMFEFDNDDRVLTYIEIANNDLNGVLIIQEDTSIAGSQLERMTYEYEGASGKLVDLMNAIESAVTDSDLYKLQVMKFSFVVENGYIKLTFEVHNETTISNRYVDKNGVDPIA